MELENFDSLSDLEKGKVWLNKTTNAGEPDYEKHKVTMVMLWCESCHAMEGQKCYPSCTATKRPFTVIPQSNRSMTDGPNARDTPSGRGSRRQSPNQNLHSYMKDNFDGEREGYGY